MFEVSSDNSYRFRVVTGWLLADDEMNLKYETTLRTQP